MEFCCRNDRHFCRYEVITINGHVLQRDRCSVSRPNASFVQRRILLKLRNRGYRMNRKTVQKLMKELDFFGLLMSELLYLRDFCSLEEFQTELELYLEYYNHSRIKAKLNGLVKSCPI